MENLIFNNRFEIIESDLKDPYAGRLIASRSHYSEIYFAWGSPALNPNFSGYGVQLGGFYTPHDGGGNYDPQWACVLHVYGFIEWEKIIHGLEYDGEYDGENGKITWIVTLSHQGDKFPPSGWVIFKTDTFNGDCFEALDIVDQAYNLALNAKKQTGSPPVPTKLLPFMKEVQEMFFRSWGQGGEIF